MKKGIITVLGKDQVGIIAKVCTLLLQYNVNVLDISQTVLDGYFHMIMVVDLTNQTENTNLHTALNELGETLGLEMRLQLAEIFDAMHHI